MERVLVWLGELGARWGLPADACRIHGWLYLTGRAATAAELAAAGQLPLSDTQSALAWLADHGIAAVDEAGRWVTDDDPWELVMRALERRRDRELGPALELLRASRREAASNPQLADRIGRLLALATDVEAIDSQVRRLSTRSLRRLMSAGGRAARLLGSVAGSGRRPPT
jgi:DNA-binding transcriptional regulator GbsR (MarR family)